MPPPTLLDLGALDLTRIVFSQDQIYEHLPHRHEFMLLSGISHFNREKLEIVGFSDIHSNDWWCHAHVPGRPLLPGVLMLEMAGQITALMAKLSGHEGFIGFGGVDRCKFRESVTPPARLHILGVVTEVRARRIASRTQGVVGDRLAFEAEVSGFTMRDPL